MHIYLLLYHTYVEGCTQTDKTDSLRKVGFRVAASLSREMEKNLVVTISSGQGKNTNEHNSHGTVSQLDQIPALWPILPQIIF